MSINQTIRFSDAMDDTANPFNLYEQVKPSRIIVIDGVPTAEIGEKAWYCIDQDTGRLYYRSFETDEWDLIYTFVGGGGVVIGADNVGGGVPLFKDETTGILNFRTITSNYIGDKAPIFRLQALDEVDLTVLRSINYVGDFSPGDASIIKEVAFDGANSGTLLLKTIISGSGIAVTEEANQIKITNTGSPSSFRSWASQTNRFVTNPGSYFGGANVHYPFNFAMDTLSNGPLLFVIDVGVTYFYTTSLTPRRYLITFSIYMESTYGLSGEQQITFGLAKNGNTSFEARTATQMVLYSSAGAATKGASVCNSFIYNVLPNETYTVGMIPRDTNGVSSSYDIKNFILTVTDAE